MKKNDTPKGENIKLDWEDVHNEAWELKKKGKLQKAKEGYYKAIEIHPNHKSYHNLGGVYAALGDREKAIFYFDKSLAINPKYALAHNNKAFSLYVLKQYDLALKSINKAIKFDKKGGITHATKAEILFAMNDEKGFYEAFETCIHLGVDPNILDPAIKKKYGKTKQYKIITGELKKEEINSSVLKEICEKIESWDATKIKEAIAILKSNTKYQKIIQDRYEQIYKTLDGKTVRSLAGFPKKWSKLTNIKKCNILTYWSTSTTFPIPSLDLSGTVRVDRWRDSHYNGQIEKFPKNLKDIKGIKIVHLWHQQLEEVPDFVYEMKDLETLDMRDNNLENVSDKLLNLKKIKVLNFEYNYGLKKLPNIGQLKNLEELYLKYTDIDALSDDFFKLKNLKKIDTTSSDLDKDTAIIKRIMTTFPNVELTSSAKEAVLLEDNQDPDEYKGKEKIRFREFNINYLPKNLFHADIVKELEIRCSNLKELPDTFDQLQTLEILKLNVGDVSILPNSITKLKNLKELHIEGWEIKTLPENLDTLTALEKLSLKCNNLENIPSSIFAITSLTRLEIEKSNTIHIPTEIKGLVNLKTLHLKDIFQLTIDASIQELVNLEEVAIEIRNADHFKNLYQFPKTLKKLTFKYNKFGRDKPGYEVSLGKLLNQLSTLQRLDVTGVSIISESNIAENTGLKELFIDGEMRIFPKGFGNLKALTSLTLFNSQLETLDTSLYNCTNLAYCRCTDIKFTTIPTGIAKMKNLIWFGFESNMIESLPEDIFELQQLERLILGESPLYKDKAFKAKIKRKIKGLKVNKSWY